MAELLISVKGWLYWVWMSRADGDFLYSNILHSNIVINISISDGALGMAVMCPSGNLKPARPLRVLPAFLVCHALMLKLEARLPSVADELWVLFFYIK